MDAVAGTPPLGQSYGYGIVLGLGFAFAFGKLSSAIHRSLRLISNRHDPHDVDPQTVQL